MEIRHCWLWGLCLSEGGGGGGEGGRVRDKSHQETGIRRSLSGATYWSDDYDHIACRGRKPRSDLLLSLSPGTDVLTSLVVVVVSLSLSLSLSLTVACENIVGVACRFLFRCWLSSCSVLMMTKALATSKATTVPKMWLVAHAHFSTKTRQLSVICALHHSPRNNVWKIPLHLAAHLSTRQLSAR